MENKIRKFFIIFLALAAGLILFFYFSKPANKYETGSDGKVIGAVEKPEIHEAGDIEAQKPLSDPPEVIKAIYATSQSAGNPKKIDELITLIRKAGLNAVVIDIKDYTGNVFYDSGIEDVARYKAEKILIPRVNTLIKKLHDENIYAIARIVVFQDPKLAAARPELAIKNNITGGTWKNNQGLAWIDPASEDDWKYIVELSRNASERGFDEINFDYIRFPSDGNLAAMSFPFFYQKKITEAESINEFFTYLRLNLKGIKISADVFGLTTSAKDDLGIGQIIENAYRNFDAVAPMVYPSHYAAGFLGFEEPAKHPYEVVKYAIASAVRKLDEYNKIKEAPDPGTQEISNAKIRPWIQAFNMGDIYGIDKIKAQIKASDEAGGIGWMIWNPANNYSFLNDF